MNERIRELAEQAGYLPDSFGVGHWDMPECKKFAELIVRKCLNEIESQRSNGENADQWTITRDLCYHNMAARLKQHFGVEE